MKKMRKESSMMTRLWITSELSKEPGEKEIWREREIEIVCEEENDFFTKDCEEASQDSSSVRKTKLQHDLSERERERERWY